MKDGLASPTTKTQSSVDTLRSENGHVGYPGSKDTKSARIVMNRRVGGHSRSQINHTWRRF